MVMEDGNDVNHFVGVPKVDGIGEQPFRLDEMLRAESARTEELVGIRRAPLGHGGRVDLFAADDRGIVADGELRDS